MLVHQHREEEEEEKEEEEEEEEDCVMKERPDEVQGGKPQAVPLM